jgi:acid phosphatase
MLVSAPGFAYTFNVVNQGALPTYVIPGKPKIAYYTVTNNTGKKLENNFVKYFPMNTTQDTSNPNNCAAAFTLESGESCTLALTVAGQVDIAVTDPYKNLFVCTQDGFSCSGTADRLNVTAAPFSKIVIVVFENEDEAVVLQQPTFNALSRSGAYFTNFHALARPSQPNYLAMIGGSTFGVTNNDPISINATTLVDLLEDNNFTWKAYAENYPGNCYSDATSPDGLYVRKHNPFMSFSTITGVAYDNPRCANIVNASEFTTDVNAQNLPDFSFYIPNLINNGHNNGAADADRWIQEYLFPIMESDYVKKSNTLFVLTFDESNPRGTPENIAENKIYTLFYGPMTQTMQFNEYYDFYNMLRTVEDTWQLGTLCRNDDSAFAVNAAVWKGVIVPRTPSNCTPIR